MPTTAKWLAAFIAWWIRDTTDKYSSEALRKRLSAMNATDIRGLSEGDWRTNELAKFFTQWAAQEEVQVPDAEEIKGTIVQFIQWMDSPASDTALEYIHSAHLKAFEGTGHKHGGDECQADMAKRVSEYFVGTILTKMN